MTFTRLPLGRSLGLLLLLQLPLAARANAIDELHRFLEGTRTLQAEFSQAVVGSNGRKPQQSSGNMAFSRPGKFRWQIEKPYPQLMVGDGEKIWIYDPELKQASSKRMSQALYGTPAALLGGDNNVEKRFVLKDAGEKEGIAWVEAVPRAVNGETGSGYERIGIGFAQGVLRAMVLQDSFGQTTTITFSKVERNLNLPAASFRFVPPAGVDVTGE